LLILQPATLSADSYRVDTSFLLSPFRKVLLTRITRTCLVNFSW